MKPAGGGADGAAAGFDIAGIVRRWAADCPDRVMLRCEGRAVAWREHDIRSSQVAQALAAAGVGAQDPVAFLGKNGVEWFEVVFAGAKLNAIHVAVNWRLAPAEVSYVVNDAEAKALFVEREFLPLLADCEGDLETVSTIVVLGGGHAQHPAYDAWVEPHPPDDPGADSNLEDVAFLLHTSGTTGSPKGVELTYENLGALRELGAVLAIGKESTSLVAMPVFHIAGSGWALIALDAGGLDVVVREAQPHTILAAISDHHITHALLVPAVIGTLLEALDHEEADLSSLRTIAYGASPISETLLRGALDRLPGCGLTQLYGLTETTGAITILRPEEHDLERPSLLRSCGRALPGVEIRVVSPETGEDVGSDEIGELCVRGRQVSKGYWRNPEATASALTKDGWFRTGDAAWLDDHSFFYLHDRLKDIIVSGGENIAPAEVENVLMAHPGVVEVAVIGVPHDKWGETPKAIVVRAAESDVDGPELITFARARLAHYKCPTSVDFADALPRTPSGKILKRDLRRPYWAPGSSSAA